jgi:hypothetical protein
LPERRLNRRARRRAGRRRGGVAAGVPDRELPSAEAYDRLDVDHVDVRCAVGDPQQVAARFVVRVAADLDRRGEGQVGWPAAAPQRLRDVEDAQHPRVPRLGGQPIAVQAV